MAVSLGERIRGLRQREGLTLAALSEAAGLSVSYLNDIEHDRTVPALMRLVDIAGAFDLRVRDLLADVAPFD